MILPSIKAFIDREPFYAPILICPLDYHGYKVSNENIEMVIEEIEYELSKYPEYTDVLLDHILSLKRKKQLLNQKEDKQ